MKHAKTGALAAFFLLTLVAALPASGQTETPPPQSSDARSAEEEAAAEAEAHRGRALEAGRSAMTLYRAGRYEEAYGSFREANELFHTPQLVLYMARCQDKRGKLLEARALYERMLAEPLPEAPSDSLVRARQSAMSELAPLRLRIPTLSVDVRGPQPSEVTLFVDGEVFPLTEPRELDPGAHDVEAISRSGARTSREVALPEGRSIAIVLRLGLFAANAALRPAAEPLPAAQSGPPVGFVVGAASAFSLSATGLVVGAVTGGLAVGQKNIVEAQCIHAACSDEGMAAANRAASFATWSDAGFAVAAIGATAGVTLVLLAPAPKRAQRVSLSVSAGELGASVRGVF
jgi:hypothetical protein